MLTWFSCLTTRRSFKQGLCNIELPWKTEVSNRESYPTLYIDNDYLTEKMSVMYGGSLKLNWTLKSRNKLSVAQNRACSYKGGGGSVEKESITTVELEYSLATYLKIKKHKITFCTVAWKQSALTWNDCLKLQEITFLAENSKQSAQANTKMKLFFSMFTKFSVWT